LDEITLRATASLQPWNPPWNLIRYLRPVNARASLIAYATASLPLPRMTVCSTEGITSVTSSARRTSGSVTP
jgi:hypothetical protein